MIWFGIVVALYTQSKVVDMDIEYDFFFRERT